MAKIYPSLISGDILNLATSIKTLEPHCAGFHLDVMDFDFVPNLTWGPIFINAIRKITKKQVWVDLLVQYPEKYIERLQLNKGDIVSIHLESKHQKNIFEQIQSLGLVPSIAIDPHTEITSLIPYLGQVGHVLLMSVTPGFSGQKFVPTSIERLEQLHALIEHLHRKPLIGMDGGLNSATLPKILEIGIDTVAMATEIFENNNPIERLDYWHAQ